MNLLLAAYFAVIGAFALAATVDPVLVQLSGVKVSFFFSVDKKKMGCMYA